MIVINPTGCCRFIDAKSGGNCCRTKLNWQAGVAGGDFQRKVRVPCGGLTIERFPVFSGPAILKELDDVTAHGDDQGDVDKASLVEDDFGEKPGDQSSRATDPEHLHIPHPGSYFFKDCHRLVRLTVPFGNSIARKPACEGSGAINSTPFPNGNARLARGVDEDE